MAHVTRLPCGCRKDDTGFTTHWCDRHGPNPALEAWARARGVRWMPESRRIVGDELAFLLAERGIALADEEFAKAVEAGWIGRAGIVQLDPAGPNERPHNAALVVRCATCDRLAPVFELWETTRGWVCKHCAAYIHDCAVCDCQYDERVEGETYLCGSCLERLPYDPAMQQRVRHLT